MILEEASRGFTCVSQVADLKISWGKLNRISPFAGHCVEHSWQLKAMFVFVTFLNVLLYARYFIKWHIYLELWPENIQSNAHLFQGNCY